MTEDIEKTDATEPTEKAKPTPPPDRRKAGRPPGSTKKADNTKPPKGDNVNPLKSVKTCPYIITTKRNVPTEVPGPDGTTTVVPRMLEETHVCGNPANGLNGFCFDHSYVIRKPITKLIGRKVKKYAEVAGMTREITITEQGNVTFQRGEHLSQEYFTKKEAAQYFEDGLVDQRLSLTDVLSNAQPLDLTEAEVTQMLLKPDDEQVKLIKGRKFSESTLRRILVQTSSAMVEKAINERL